MDIFDSNDLGQLARPRPDSTKGQNGQITIIGGSKLFHGAPLLALSTASRFVDMVYFTSPEPSVGNIAEKMKSELLSFIWVPWKERDDYIRKSDAVLIGSGMMRCRNEKGAVNIENFDDEGQKTKNITEELLKKFPDKKWVIDAGSLQMIDPALIPPGAILTPNQKEYQRLFGDIKPQEAAKKYNCVITYKLPATLVVSPSESIEVHGGNPGMTKGGTGDVQAGLTVALLAKNDAFLAGAAASYLVKKAADGLFEKVGTAYNADDLARAIPLYFPQVLR